MGLETRVIVFNAFNLIAVLYAFARGGAPERVAGAQLLCASILTHVVHAVALSDFSTTETGVLAVDLGLFVGLVALALYADRFWPLWIAALHGLGTTAHIVKAIDPTILRLAYAMLTKVWAYPITAILIVATVRHQRRLSQAGCDPDWSFQSAA